MISIFLSGNSYDIGYQHGEILKNLIHSAIRKFCRYYHNDQIPPQKDLDYKVKKLESFYPDILDEIKGIADGSGSRFQDILPTIFFPGKIHAQILPFLKINNQYLVMLMMIWIQLLILLLISLKMMEAR